MRNLNKPEDLPKKNESIVSNNRFETSRTKATPQLIPVIVVY
jgi:hypothetical protein